MSKYRNINQLASLPDVLELLELLLDVFEVQTGLGDPIILISNQLK